MLLLKWTRLVAIVITLIATATAIATRAQTFTTPIMKNPYLADPSVVLVNGTYYYISSGDCPNTNGAAAICLRSASSIPALGSANVTTSVIWTAPACSGTSMPNCADIWAPQIRYINNSWYVYYAADSTGNNNVHRLFALTPTVANNPMGAWQMANTGAPSGQLVTDWVSNWAIDPDVFPASDGKTYLIYSCRQDSGGDANVEAQSICLSAMSDPLHLATDPTNNKMVVKLSAPVLNWEKRGTLATQEGPFGFTHNGIDYIAYSAGFSGNADAYNVGLLINNHPPQPVSGENPLTNPASWIKQGPVFDGHDTAYGTASTVLVNSPDNTQLWNVYHGTDCLTNCQKDSNGYTWIDRSIRAQMGGWTQTGDLDLGYPVSIVDTADGTGRSVNLAYPSSGNSGAMPALPAWGAAYGDAAEYTSPTGGLVVGSWTWAQTTPSSITMPNEDNQLDQIFYASNPNYQSYVVYTNIASSGHAATGTPRYGIFPAYVDQNNYVTAMIDVTGCAAPGCLVSDAVVSGTDEGSQSCTLPSGFNAASANTLIAEVAGGTVTYIVNGTTLTGSCQNRTYNLNSAQPGNGSNGQVGVAARSSKAVYTNFNVSPGLPLDSSSTPQVYAFRNQSSKMNLDNSCDGGCGLDTTNGTAVIQYATSTPYPLTTSQTQLWTLQHQSNGTFTITSTLSGLCLDDPYANTSPSRTLPQAAGNSTMLWQNVCNGNPSTQWNFIPNGDGTWLIQSQASGLVLDSYDNNQSTQAWLNTNSAGTKQRWQLVIQ